MNLAKLTKAIVIIFSIITSSIVPIAAVKIAFDVSVINKKLDKVIELSQPEALNIIDEKFILDNKL